MVSLSVQVHCHPGSLVLVLGCSDQEAAWLISTLTAQGEQQPPRRLDSELQGERRAGVYKEGGVLLTTPRILVMDLLLDRCPAHLVTGLLLYRAHTVLESCQESFVLRLYRQKNKTGFIKAFSSSPVSFSRGFNQVERVMRNLFVR